MSWEELYIVYGICAVYHAYQSDHSKESLWHKAESCYVLKHEGILLKFKCCRLVIFYQLLMLVNASSICLMRPLSWVSSGLKNDVFWPYLANHPGPNFVWLLGNILSKWRKSLFNTYFGPMLVHWFSQTWLLTSFLTLFEIMDFFQKVVPTFTSNLWCTKCFYYAIRMHHFCVNLKQLSWGGPKNLLCAG